MSNNNNNIAPKPISNDGSIITNQIVPDILLQSIEPLMDILRIHITDYILQLRKQLFSKDEFNTVGRIAKRLGISRLTIYNWIDRKLINCYYIDDKKVVSLSEVRLIMQTVYKPKNKNNKDISSIEHNKNNIDDNNSSIEDIL